MGIVRDHWVPTIPGYSGYIPGKHPENICGGGVMHTCKMAGRAIAERHGAPPASESQQQQGLAQTQDPSMSRSRLVEEYHARSMAEGFQLCPNKLRVADTMRGHCERQIPGYSGHVPRLHGESVCGATSAAANLLAANLAEDKIFNPENHARTCLAPQAPPARKLRF